MSNFGSLTKFGREFDMKKTYLFIIITLVITACASPQTSEVSETSEVSAATQTPLPTETLTPTPSPAELMLQYIDPTMRDNFQPQIGEEEYSELSASIGPNGEISGHDYASWVTDPESKFEGTVVPESIVVRQTADFHYKQIVVGEATNKNGKTGVVWNPDTGKWVVLTTVNQDIKDYDNYTHFRNWENMMQSGDMDLVLLAQGIGSEPFPQGTEQAQYVIATNHGSILNVGGKRVTDVTLFLDAARSDYDFSDHPFFEELNGGAFTEGHAPRANPAIIILDGEDGNPRLALLPTVLGNADGTNIIAKNTMDPLLLEGMMGRGVDGEGRPIDSFNEIDGRTMIEWAFEGRTVKIVPVFPTGNPDDWNNYGRNQTALGTSYDNSMEHGILVVDGMSFSNSAPVEMLEGDSTIFNSLPDNMKAKINADLEIFRNTNFGFGGVTIFENGVITPEFAMALSRNISETGFSYGYQPAK